MPLLADLGVASTVSIVLFFVLLGVLALFVETLGIRRALAAMAGLTTLAVVLASVEEPGIAIVLLGATGAIAADDVFDRFAGR